MPNQKPSFSQWLTDRNITFIIISILVVYALERFAKSLHQDLITPTFEKCLAVTGLTRVESAVVKRKTWQKVVINVFELSFSVVILFLLSRFVFRHDRPVNLVAGAGQAANSFLDKNVFVVHFVSDGCGKCGPSTVQETTKNKQ